MFDEKSSKWILIYKGYVKVMFFLYLIAAVVLAIVGWTDGIMITDSAFLDGLILLAGSTLVAFLHLVINMLVLQFLNNVQVIREKLENK